MPEPRRAAGWYDDDADAAILRYWDGAKWSPHTAPRPPHDDAHERLVALFREDAPPRTTAPHAEPASATVGPGVAATTAPAVTVTLPLRAPDEHTTVPLPDEPAASRPGDRRRRVGGRR
ncbi:DUF2510 domain-containing protein [Agromyces mariniharenae]|uniref:DUF2510 domain-containing protein n=1 Tax=Agromyces mariniharenae TaxID=2604423 RepID=UPI001652DF54|nr:DUF2510 domain-containing protein [Agromyces mariniharenae]